MMKRIAILGAAAALLLALLLAVGSVGAHEGRPVGDYNFVVGFLYEPAYEGLQNGVSIRVTKPGDPGSHDGHTHGAMETGQDEGADDHGSMSHEAMESQTPVGLQVSAEADASGGVAVTIETENWRWAPENVDRQHRDGEGHAHIYVDGEKIGRAYGPSYYITGLEPGQHDIRVTLNANSHNNLLVDGELVEAMTTITAPESNRERAGRADPVAAQSAMSLQVTAHPDSAGGYNLQVVPRGFAFLGESAESNADALGYGVLRIDGEDYTRLHVPWFQLPTLDAGTHEITVGLSAQDGRPYQWNGELVESTVMVRVEDDDGTAAMTAAEGSESGGHQHETVMVGVEGLEATLQVEVTHVDSGASQTMNLRPAFEDPGHYVADLIPTDVGVYRLRVFGAVEGNSVDESFISHGGGGDFDDIRASADLQFPKIVPAAREIEAAARGAQASADDAADSAAAARTMGVVGIVLGVVGVAVGGAALAVSLRK